jgi:hypothetical protein
VTGRFLSTVSVLALPENASENVPTQREQVEAGFRKDLISALKQKQGAALAVSAGSIVEDAAIHASPLPVDLKQATTRQLVETFDSLSYQKQAELLRFRWSALDHQEMLPVLRRIAGRDLNEMWSDEASGAALQRWYQKAPDEARPGSSAMLLAPLNRNFSHSLIPGSES